MIGFSVGGGWDAFYLLQMTNMVQSMNIAYPSGAYYFYDAYKWTNFQDGGIATWLRYGFSIDGNIATMRPPIFNMYQAGYLSNNIAWNLADLITVIMFGLALIPCVTVIKLLLPNARIINNLDAIVKGRYLIAVVNLTYLRAAFHTFLNYSAFQTDTATRAFNSYFSIVMLCYIAGVPAYYFVQMIIYWKEVKVLR